MTRIYPYLIFCLACVMNAQAQTTSAPTQFTLVPEKESGISYLNTITEDDSLNVFSYEYLYNGAGVGIADFNNDGLTDVFFSGNTAANKLFLNKGGFHFEDITRKANVKGNGTWSTGVSIADINGDGLPDIYVCHSGKFKDPEQLSNELFINQGVKDGVPVFKEMAKEYGLDAPGTQSTQAAFFDYDNDGDLDMFLLNHSNHTYNPLLNTKKVRATPDMHFGNRLFRNDKDANGQIHFTDVTLKAGIINNALNFGLSVTVSDVNKDGWPDIYTTSDYTEVDCFYVNNHDGTFTESLSKSFAHVSKFSMGADIADYNNDGLPDVFTLDMLPEDNHRQKLLKGPDEYDQYHLLLDSGYYHQQMRNMLQLNRGTDAKGNVRFSEIGQLAGISNTDWSWAGLFADFDNDGWKDLFVSNGYLRDYTDMDFLKYTVADAQKTSLKEGIVNFKTYDLVKKMASNKLSNYIFQNKRDLTFANKTKDWGLYKPGVSNAAAYADLDNDGDLDLIVCNNNEPAFVYRNNQNEVSPTAFIKLKLKGEGLNTAAFGTKITFTTDDGLQQYQELYPVRGYQSSISPEIIFGYPSGSQPAKLELTWPNGKQTVLTSISSGKTIELAQADARPKEVVQTASTKLFTDITAQSGLTFRHTENDFIDFKDEVLLPYQLSREGPALAKADVNGDKLEDVFVGGAIGQSGVLYLQTSQGTFMAAGSQPWTVDAASEDVNAVFFDADNDGDMDLYVVSGGNEYADGSPEYNDRLYLNDGKGNFIKEPNALPAMLSDKQAVAVGDFDNDGDLDLFIGGRVVPGSFPMAARSYLLRNDTKNGSVHFTDVTEDAWRKPGMVTAAAWADLDNDHFPELLIAGDWMNVMLFKNNAGKLTNISAASGVQNLNGMWASINAADVDGDGDTDFILGNCGYNNQFKASKDQPVTLYAADFDDNGTIDPIMCYYIQGTSYPVASRDELLDQIVPLKRKYIKYKDYADATVNDIFSKDKVKKAGYYHCDELASGILYNNGNMKFSFSPLPLVAQFSRISAAVVQDFDKDGINDILLSGNFYPYRTTAGRNDAGYGVLLKGKGNKTFESVEPGQAGMFMDGDCRKMVSLKTASGETLIIAAKNDDNMQVLKLNM
ncbi:VCBS repeat-containing protein [Danxiaibacter flavus]|uniref:VCBS repeat-containing protein n=1 Tax=Danxiaibacter flavus TaxID=3049108 RepID=A0ABV3ZIL4_9BACT|nr:VCBS repeat-containing protein [Chitinophagaceae bacterium DXS]